jgi:hypothetical protein
LYIVINDDLGADFCGFTTEGRIFVDSGKGNLVAESAWICRVAVTIS